MSVLGIDPGTTGAIAALGDDGQLLGIVDVPVFEIGGKKRIDVHTLGAMLGRYADAEAAVIELVGAMPGQGVSSMFSFGFATGVVHGAIGALMVPIVTVTPAKWKAHFKLPKDKDAARQLATRRWPATDLFRRVKDAGRAEAALIGLYHLETRRSGGVTIKPVE